MHCADHFVELVAFFGGKLAFHTTAANQVHVQLAGVPGRPAVRVLEALLQAVTLGRVIALPEDFHNGHTGACRVAHLALELVE